MNAERRTTYMAGMCSIASLLATGLLGGCITDLGEESDSGEGPARVGERDAIAAVQQALTNARRFDAISEPPGVSPRAEFQLFRASTSFWWAQRTYDGQGTGWQLSRTAQYQDVPVSMDINGDGLSDQATWRPSSGVWQWRESTTGLQWETYWGRSGDIPTPGDFDGDGKTDIAIWHPPTGNFHVVNSSNRLPTVTQWGQVGDIPVVGDYDGDGRDDVAVFRPANGTWYYIRSSNGSHAWFAWGTAGDIPLAADFDGDGKTDLTVYRPGPIGLWYTWKSSNGSHTVTQWGTTCDVPLPADHDGDGKADIAVRRLEQATNYFINSSTGVGVQTAYGWTTDIPANASTFCYIGGVLRPCRYAACGVGPA